jgi:DNA polymerase I-like protein with 3'-5' exonuclease and polymerase domains
MVPRIAFDTETFDPLLGKPYSMGSGVYRKDGYVLGCSIATEDGFKEYYNLGHRGITQEERNKSISKITEWMSTDADKVGANPLYDMDWLTNSLGIPIKGRIYDVLGVEALLDEYRDSYSLDTISVKYLNEHKISDAPKRWCVQHGYLDDFRKHLFEMPYEDVRDYAIGDVTQPLQILRKQENLIVMDDLGPVHLLESDLLPVLSLMRKNGIKIDRNKRTQLTREIKSDLSIEEHNFKMKYGDVNIKSNVQLAQLFSRMGWHYPVSAKGNPSFGKEVLEGMDYPPVHDILSMREKRTMLSFFLEGAWVDFDTNGRIHCDFLPLHQDEGGTVTGRLSSQHPNLQQVSADHGEEHPYSGRMREVFVPEEDCWYGKIDESQIEYRLIVHYAKGMGALEAQQRYNNDPTTDYHQMIMDMVGITDRKLAKRLNFGVAYYMGWRSMARKFHWTPEQAKTYMGRYMRLVPFIGPTREAVKERAEKVGYIRTLYGRRARMSQAIRDNKKEYVAFNRLIQGTAADWLKLAMVNADKGGVFNVLIPHITVHDELGVSIPKTIEGVEAYEALKIYMEEPLKIRVPMIAEAEYGSSWGSTVSCSSKDNCDKRYFDAMRSEIGS